MGRVKPSKFEIFLNYKLWLSSVTGEGIIEEDRYKLLQLIKERGSLKAAADEMKISYRKAWGDLKKAEDLLGYELIIRKRGGKDGGQSQLTDKAIKLLAAYHELHVKMDDAVENAYEEFKKFTSIK
ncbi:MAG: LysR family transcriptional regulator [Bacteroidales bacterium]|jgi:molybdate transport repressor ModE-like protein|nr:LysR family transcriptional regulator [Bacteroidales bacterium]